MKRLFLMRHGQTEYNLAHRIQGHCDSPLTELGIEQARASALWLRDERITPVRLASSPLPRATRTLDVVVEVNPGFAALPRTDEDGLIERCYGSFEGGPRGRTFRRTPGIPRTPWSPMAATPSPRPASAWSRRSRASWTSPTATCSPSRTDR